MERVFEEIEESQEGTVFWAITGSLVTLMVAGAFTNGIVGVFSPIWKVLIGCSIGVLWGKKRGVENRVYTSETNGGSTGSDLRQELEEMAEKARYLLTDTKVVRSSLIAGLLIILFTNTMVPGFEVINTSRLTLTTLLVGGMIGAGGSLLFSRFLQDQSILQVENAFENDQSRSVRPGEDELAINLPKPLEEIDHPRSKGVKMTTRDLLSKKEERIWEMIADGNQKEAALLFGKMTSEEQEALLGKLDDLDRDALKKGFSRVE